MDDAAANFDALYAAANFGITLGYLFVSVAVLPYVEVRTWVKWAGALFFFTCGLTHLDMAIYAAIGTHHPITTYGFINHVVQVVAVWVFVIGLYLEFSPEDR